jgi:hypothetical protein
VGILLDQANFMADGGQTTDLYNPRQTDLYSVLIAEESREFLETQQFGYAPQSKADDIKEAVDIIVVASGYLISRLGMSGACKAWELVHANNVAKLAGKIEKREDGKILKGATGKEERKRKLLAALEELL